MKMMAIGETWFLWMTGQLAIFEKGREKKNICIYTTGHYKSSMDFVTVHNSLVLMVSSRNTTGIKFLSKCSQQFH